MEDFQNVINTCKSFKKEAIEILGIEQSVYEIDEHHGIYDIAILTANIDEFDSIKNILNDFNRVISNKNDSTLYYSGKISSAIKTYKVIVPLPYAMGIEASSALTTKVIGKFRPKYIFMTGICAGNKAVVKIGDIIIAEKSLNYHSIVSIERKDATKDKKLMHQISSINGNLKSQLELLSRSSEIKKIYETYPNKTHLEPNLRCHLGLLVTGSSLVRSSKAMQEINTTYPGVKGLDMETYGLYYESTQVFKDYAPNFVSIKSVSDYGDEKPQDLSPVERKKYALHTSSSVLKHFLINHLE
jgi:nucleoside phosphorylase